MHFGSPTLHIHSELSSLAKALKIECTVLSFPDHIHISYSKPDSYWEDSIILSCSEYIRLGSIHTTSLVCRAVALKQIPVAKGLAQMHMLLNAAPRYNPIDLCFISSSISALFCIISLGGSFYDMCFAALFGLLAAPFLVRGKNYKEDFSLSSFT